LAEWFLVEAPGTAPGSEWFISQAIYRHIWRTSIFNIGDVTLDLKFIRANYLCFSVPICYFCVYHNCDSV